MPRLVASAGVYHSHAQRRITFPKINQALVAAWNDAQREVSRAAQTRLLTRQSDREQANYASANGAEGGDGFGLYDNNMSRWGDDDDQGHGENPLFEGTDGEADRIYDCGGTGEQITDRARDLVFQQLLDSVIFGHDSGAPPPVPSRAARRISMSEPELETEGVRREAAGKRRNIGPEDIGKRVSVAGRGDGVLQYYGPHRSTGAAVCGVALDEAIGDHNGTSEVRISLFCCACVCFLLVYLVRPGE